MPKEICQRCGGDGLLEVFRHDRPTWREPESYVDCDVCEGTGKVEVEEEEDPIETLRAAANGLLVALGHTPLAPRKEPLPITSEPGWDGRKS